MKDVPGTYRQSRKLIKHTETKMTDKWRMIRPADVGQREKLNIVVFL